MSELDSAWRWYETQRTRLKAVDDLIRDGRSLIMPELEALLRDFTSLPLKARLAKLKAERDDLNRMAFVRLFAGFEADFRVAFAGRLRATRAAQNANTTDSQDAVLHALGESIKFVMGLHATLDPRDLSKSALGRVSDMRMTRNALVHEGFADRAVDDPATIYGDLKRVLQPFAAPSVPDVGAQ